jgi:hypothetical protein
MPTKPLSTDRRFRRRWAAELAGWALAALLLPMSDAAAGKSSIRRLLPFERAALVEPVTGSVELSRRQLASLRVRADAPAWREGVRVQAGRSGRAGQEYALEAMRRAGLKPAASCR